MSQLLWDSVRSAAGVSISNQVQIDTQILRLHSRLSLWIFLMCSLVLTFRQVVGPEDIMCFADNLKATTSKDDTLNTFCWANGTYSVIGYFHKCPSSGEKDDCIYPGVGALLQPNARHRDRIIFQRIAKGRDKIKYHSYYQWTVIALFFQAVLCYIPKFVWRNCENGLQGKLACDKRFLYYPIIADDEGTSPKTHMECLVNYFKTHQGHHLIYFVSYCCCELAGLIFTIGHIFIINAILSNQFISYGSDFIKFWLFNDDPNDVSPMVKIFPLMAKCTPKKYGPSGNIFPQDAVCMLPLNSINGNIYLLLWFYLYFVIIISSFAVIYRLLTLNRKFGYFLLKSQSGKLKDKVLEDLCKKGDVGDRFVMFLMRKNMSQAFFQEFLESFWEESFKRELSV